MYHCVFILKHSHPSSDVFRGPLGTFRAHTMHGWSETGQSKTGHKRQRRHTCLGGLRVVLAVRLCPPTVDNMLDPVSSASKPVTETLSLEAEQPYLSQHALLSSPYDSEARRSTYKYKWAKVRPALSFSTKVFRREE